MDEELIPTNTGHAVFMCVLRTGMAVKVCASLDHESKTTQFNDQWQLFFYISFEVKLPPLSETWMEKAFWKAKVYER